MIYKIFFLLFLCIIYINGKGSTGYDVYDENGNIVQEHGAPDAPPLEKEAKVLDDAGPKDPNLDEFGNPIVNDEQAPALGERDEFGNVINGDDNNGDQVHPVDGLPILSANKRFIRVTPENFEEKLGIFQFFSFYN